jgi:hypothetical protein
LGVASELHRTILVVTANVMLENVFHIKKVNSPLLGLVGLQELMTGKKMASGPASSL